MSVQECIRIYQPLSKDLFEIPRHTLRAGRVQTLVRAEHLDNVIKSTLLHNSDLTLQASPELCKTYIDTKLSMARCLN